MTQIKFRRDTSINWTTNNPILGQGEPGYETDTKKLKIGDGTSHWIDLPYQNNEGGGGSGDVTQVGDNIFTGTNTFRHNNFVVNPDTADDSSDAYGLKVGNEYFYGVNNKGVFVKPNNSAENSANLWLFNNQYNYSILKQDYDSDSRPRTYIGDPFTGYGLTMSPTYGVLEYKTPDKTYNLLNPTVDTSNLVTLDGDQHITGRKIFDNQIALSDGNSYYNALEFDNTSKDAVKINGDTESYIIPATSKLLYSSNYLFDNIYKSDGTVEGKYYAGYHKGNLKLGDGLKFTYPSITMHPDESWCYEQATGEAVINIDAETANNNTDLTTLMAHSAMPSNRYVDLTLGTSGSTYIAPADGWIYLAKATSGTQWVALFNSIGLGYRVQTTSVNCAVALPIKKNENFSASYTATGETVSFKFFYAEGVSSE